MRINSSNVYRLLVVEAMLGHADMQLCYIMSSLIQTVSTLRRLLLGVPVSYSSHTIHDWPTRSTYQDASQRPRYPLASSPSPDCQPRTSHSGPSATHPTHPCAPASHT